ncbi:hypothetical protein V6Z11_D08G293900 [Gossypium hirsutum]
MGDPYYRYPLAAADRAGSIPRSAFPGYFSSEAPSLTSHHADMQVASSDINQMQPGKYGVNDISNPGVYPESNLGGLSAGANTRAYPSSFGDPSLGTQRWNASVDLFRPFTGYKDIKVVHKEPRRRGDRAMVLCFVEFDDSKCAMTAMAALQGYKFDDKKPDSPALRIQFAHFPFHLQNDQND